jgi:hypothetical protein
MTPEDILDKVYRLGYDRGWGHRGDEVPFLGYGAAEPTRETHLPDPERWLAELYGNLDLSNIVYGRLKHHRPYGENTTWSHLYYVPDAESKGKVEARSFLHEHLDLGSIAMGRTMDEVQTDPATYISQLREHIRDLERENEALRGTHPNGDLDAEDGEWELDADSPSERTVWLDDSKVFDRAVIEFDTEVRAERGEPGSVVCGVDIDSIKLVSDN